jgi:single-strand DNA-binding protein
MYQRIVLVGNLGRDPEMRYTQTGTPVTSFSVATSRKYNTADGQQKEETLWFRVQVWGKQAEVCNQYLGKGRSVLVEGSLVGDETGGPRIWTGQDGKPRASFEVRAQTVRFLGRREAEPSAPTARTPGAESSAGPGAEPPTEEELPF